MTTREIAVRFMSLPLSRRHEIARALAIPELEDASKTGMQQSIHILSKVRDLGLLDRLEQELER